MPRIFYPSRRLASSTLTEIYLSFSVKKYNCVSVLRVDPCLNSSEYLPNRTSTFSNLDYRRHKRRHLRYQQMTLPPPKSLHTLQALWHHLSFFIIQRGSHRTRQTDRYFTFSLFRRFKLSTRWFTISIYHTRSSDFSSSFCKRPDDSDVPNECHPVLVEEITETVILWP